MDAADEHETTPERDYKRAKLTRDEKVAATSMMQLGKASRMLFPLTLTTDAGAKVHVYHVDGHQVQVPDSNPQRPDESLEEFFERRNTLLFEHSSNKQSLLATCAWSGRMLKLLAPPAPFWRLSYSTPRRVVWVLNDVLRLTTHKKPCGACTNCRHKQARRGCSAKVVEHHLAAIDSEHAAKMALRRIVLSSWHA